MYISTCKVRYVTSVDLRSSLRQRLLVAAVLSGLLLSMLDQTIVGTALPHIVRALGGASLYLWVVIAYLVPATVLVPVYARLSDRHGRRALLLVGMAVFLIGSALCAVAQTMPELIAFRALQGTGAGALESLSFILLADLYTGRRSAFLQSAMAGLMAVSFIGGPLIGGLLADHVGWRSVFTVNLPIGALAMIAVAALLPSSVGRHEAGGAPVDLVGIALLTLGVGLLLVGVSTPGARGGTTLSAWLAPDAGGLILAGALIIAAFVAAERRTAAPILPLGLLRQTPTAAILAAAATGGFGLFAAALLLPRYYQLTRHVSATHSGLLIYPLLVGIVVSVNLAAAIITRRLEYRLTLLAGGALALLGAGSFLAFDAHTPGWWTTAGMALLGLGVGPMFSGLQIATQRTVAPARLGTTMGALILLRQVGASLAIAAAGAVYSAGRSHGAAVATGHAVAVIGILGTLVAVAALAALPARATRLAPLPAAAPPPDAHR